MRFRPRRLPFAPPIASRTRRLRAGWCVAIASFAFFACASAYPPASAKDPPASQAPAGSQNARLAFTDEPAISARAPLGFLHADWTRIVDAGGNVVQMRGVNLGGWLLWEAWIWEGNINVFNLPAQAETNIRKQLATLVGAQEFRAFEAAFYDNFIQESDIEAVAAEGFNTVRVLFNYRLLEDDAAPGQ